MTNREAYLDDLDELLKEIDQLLSAVPIGKTKLEHQAREQAEDVAGRARATINCGEGAAMRHSPHLREAAHTTITP